MSSLWTTHIDLVPRTTSVIRPLWHGGIGIDVPHVVLCHAVRVSSGQEYFK